MDDKLINNVFNQFIGLYDIADEFENNGEPEKAIEMRTTLNIVGSFIQSVAVEFRQQNKKENE